MSAKRLGATDAGARDVVREHDRRAELLLAVLRLSRDPDLLPRLEAATAALDGAAGTPPVPARRAERTLLRVLGGRLPGTLPPGGAAAWDAELRAEGEDASAAAWAERSGQGPPPAGTSPGVAAALRAAGELQARLDRGDSADQGTADGWRVASRLTLRDAGSGWLPTELWALQAPDPGDREEIAFVATGSGPPTPWSRSDVDAELGRRQADVAATEAFTSALRHDGPVQMAARRREAMAEFRCAQAASEKDRRGRSVIHARAGRPVRTTGAVLLGPGREELAAGVEALRVDAAPPPDRPWGAQSWVRRLPTGEWRRGRLRPEADRVVFVDEPGAGTPERGDGVLPWGGPAAGRRLGRDAADSAEIRRKAAGSAVYATLLYAALANTRWRHRDGSEWQGGQRSAGALMAAVVGTGDYLDWAWSGPSGVVDEEVAADLRALGWERDVGA